MSDLTSQQQQLMTGWQALHQDAAQVLDWVTEVRANAPEVDDAADSINLKLYRVRNQARDLGRVAGTPMTMGFFGLSQAGKSYLISALAAGKDGELETIYGDSRLDFIEHINPVGGGKEATGLVTRFSRTAKSGPTAFPIELKLFSEVELAKILANSWFNDFNHEKVEYQLNDARISALLNELEPLASKHAHIGVSAEDVVSLWDYLEDSFANSVSKLRSHYWPEVLKLAPRLNCAQRSKLFAVLWGEQPKLTEIYADLAATLQRLQGAAQVFAPLSALVKPAAHGYSQQDSIMNVDMLERLGSSRDQTIEVCPAKNGELAAPVSISLAQLATLTAELTFPLVNPTRDPQVEKVDLLDFPGYRGRLSICSVEEAGSQSSEGGNPVSQLLLRGKVAYLFERYTDSQEMNCLVVCTSSAKQSDVTSVGPVLTRWIQKTQGKDAQERGQRAPGLIWALTMCDMAISNALNRNEGQLKEGWDGLIKMTMQERFGQYEWMQNWAGGKPFNNTFLVRKPRMDVPFIDLCPDTQQELAMGERYQEKLALMESTFASTDSVKQHVDQPAAAWQAMLSLDNGGIQHISQYLGKVANIDFKLARIQEQLTASLGQIHESLGHWYEDGREGAEAKQAKQAKNLLQALGNKTRALGEIMRHLQLKDEQIRELYLSGNFDDVAEKDDEPEQSEPEVKAAVSLYAEDNGFNFDFDNLSSEPEPQKAPAHKTELQTHEHRFSQAVFKAWINHLYSLSDRQNLLNMLGIDASIMNALADELITAARRQEIPARLTQAALARTQSGARREQLAQGQVLSAQLVMGDFIAWQGELNRPIAARNKQLMGDKAPLYSNEQNVALGELPQLPSQAIDQARRFMLDWLSALYHNTIDNAGHSAGRGISSEQNTLLGTLLARLSNENAQ
ncbi:putative virulence factor [Oceanisphaera sp. W20_SRM_FM3]|uniref:putative virulence factor n=1 Tax=Oceanisphaera sp. W20_SRM_FM3 TaxID=3240267 RepID=UPI003F9D4576